MSRPQRPDGANRPERSRPPLVNNARPQPEPVTVPAQPVPTREEVEIYQPSNAYVWAPREVEESAAFRAYKTVLDALVLVVGLWWLLGPLLVMVLLLFHVVDPQTVEGWWL